MSSDQLIAVTTDALRGVLQAAMPAGATVVMGAPSPDAQLVSGLFLHLFRIGTAPDFRNGALPARDASGARASASPLALELDYLISGLGGEALEELGLLGSAMRLMQEQPVITRQSLPALLSQPERWVGLAEGLELIRWQALELSLEQQCQVWVASGIRQRGGVFCRVGVVWQAANR